MTGDVLRVAIVGGGPSGLYLAESLMEQNAVRVHVDVFDRLPTPFGLLRYGVAPDHLKIKSMARVLQRILNDPRLRFFGNVTVGRDLTVPELRERYNVVVYAYGASQDRRLNIEGEDLRGSVAAAELVRWYSSHPDAAAGSQSLTRVRSVVVVGVGNVAIDVARVLLKDPGLLETTDMTPALVAKLRESTVTDVHLLGRRGPVDASFSYKELKELTQLDGLDVRLHPAAPAPTHPSDQPMDRNEQLLRDLAARPVREGARTLHVHFFTKPLQVLGDAEGRVCAVQVEELDSRLLTLDAQLVVRAVGYVGNELLGVPLSEVGVVPNNVGRVTRDEGSLGEYAVGWIGRGATGVLGTNRSDAEALSALIVADAPHLILRPLCGTGVTGLLELRRIPFVTQEGWARIDAREIELGQLQTKARCKIASWTDLVSSSQHVPVPSTVLGKAAEAVKNGGLAS